jgi:hypothetical protein
MNAKDLQIETQRKEERDEYEQWLEWVEVQQEWVSSLIEHGHIPTTKEQHHA